ncbi:hypothetical protein [Streptomyces sp. NBC_01803]|uniref:hypothetical protein n=1 Tax=Streptomyces sp. NBC_01803 TaxID=2975946 RepID=UPI002DDC46D4|nr:hypothetical protein [Streptomyces sp. NBC_01803]WSA43704.1 hypothetical protein OIE51_05505 [Streptomyces sp. NBC_01803]
MRRAQNADPAPGRPSALSAEQAVAELREAGFEPEEDYPGNTLTSWTMRCTICGTPRRTTLNNVRRKGGCWHGDDRRFTHQQAADILAALGHRPLEDYPGRRIAPWHVACGACHQPYHRSLSLIHTGRPCPHCHTAPRRTTPDHDKEASR